MALKKFYSLYIPVSFDLIFLKNKNDNIITIILYNKEFTITFISNKNKFILDLEFYCLKFKRDVDNKHINYNLNFKEINKYLKTFEIYFFIKIKFKGKGFKIKFNKKLKLIKFFFGRSHITYYVLKKIKLKKITKYKFILKSLNLSKLRKKASDITYIKPVNLYTLRGIRISRQTIKKRKGKKSSYM